MKTEATIKARVAVLCRWLVMVPCLFVAVAAAAQEQEPAGAGAETDSPAPEPERLLITSGLATDALAREYPQAAVWLDTGEGNRELALLDVEYQSPAKGAVLILAGEGESAASGLAGAMREPLAVKGWATMTLGLAQSPLQVAMPAPATATPPANGGEAADPSGTTPADSASGGVPATAAPPSSSSAASGAGGSVIDVMTSPDPEERQRLYQDRIQSALSAGVAELRGRGYQRIALVGIGRAAVPIMREALAAPGQPRELVWVAPLFAAGEQDAWPGALAEVADWRLLELTNVLADPRTARRRAAVFRRQGIRGYQQQPVALAQPVDARDADQVVNRISAWLDREGAGER